MDIGFDFGTSNCAVATMDGDKAVMSRLEGEHVYIPSTLAAPNRASVSEYLFKHHGIKPISSAGDELLRRSMQINREESIDLDAQDVAFGREALSLYLSDPAEVYYVKSPKSFLGTTGVHEAQLAFFEDLVCAMMINVKARVEAQVEQEVRHVVIGKPVNFQGIGGEDANRQALAILENAAIRAGFRDTAFQFEPVAAGLAYEATLTDDKVVLVVDIGGGTTDCSLLRMGPSWRALTERSASLIAHSGERVGGNDLDIHLAFAQLMPHFGRGSKTLAGLEMPTLQFWNPIAINDVVAQRKFYARENESQLRTLLHDAQEVEKLERLLDVYEQALGYHVVKQAESLKIALSEAEQLHDVLVLPSEKIDIDISEADMVEAIRMPMGKMTRLIEEVMLQGGARPQVVFVTGGSARSPVLRQAIEQAVPEVPIVSGDYFGSVTAGLARWAQLCFA